MKVLTPKRRLNNFKREVQQNIESKIFYIQDNLERVLLITANLTLLAIIIYKI